MNRLLLATILFLSIPTQIFTQEVYIDFVNNSCPESDVLTVCLGNNNSYEGQYHFRTFDHFCGEEITGILRIFRNEVGEYFVDDFSFGTWPFCYGIDGPKGTLRLNVSCNTVESITGTDNYGDIWGTEEISYTGSSLVIKWFNSYPEFGTTELTPVDGRPINEPETYLESAYSFDWSTGESRQSIQINNPGDYSVSVTGPNGFSENALISIPEDPSVFEPGCSGEILELSYYLDKNQNGIRDAEEEFIITGEEYVSLSPREKYSSFEGRYSERYVVDPGKYIIQNVHPDFDITNTNTIVDVKPSSGVMPYLVGLHSDKQISRADIDISSLNPERCNRVVPFRITIKNTGTIEYDDRVSLNFDPLITFVSADKEPSVNETGLLSWDIDIEEHGQESTIALLLKMPGGDYTGDIFCIQASGSVNEKSNSDFCFALRCSYDPNDKHGTPFRGDRNLCLFEEELKYTIRFENLGNDTAFDVRIEDQLHSGLDLNSFKLLQSSHDVTRHYINSQRNLVLFFDNILLPSKEQDTIANKGFVQFAIRTNSGLEEESIINNSAEIYFDLNDPVITNETKHTMVSEFGTTSIKEPDANPVTKLKVWPNPSNEFIFLDLEKPLLASGIISLFDARGMLVMRQNLTSNKIDVSQLNSGIYFVQIKNKLNGSVQLGRFVHK